MKRFSPYRLSLSFLIPFLVSLTTACSMYPIGRDADQSRYRTIALSDELSSKRLIKLLEEIQTTGDLKKIGAICDWAVQKSFDDPFFELQISDLLNKDNNYTLGEKFDRTQLREFLVSYLRGNYSRRSVFSLAALEDLRNSSNRLATLMANANEELDVLSPFTRFDFTVVGGGVHDSIFSATIEKLAELKTKKLAPLKGMTAEGTDVLTSNFALKGEGFRINSTNRQTLGGGDDLPGVGNLNYLQNGKIQLSDLSAEKYPTAKDLADAITINRSLTQQDILMNYKVTKVYPLWAYRDLGYKMPAGMPKIFKTQISDVGEHYGIVFTSTLDPKKTIYATSNDVINAIGLGNSKLPDAIIEASDPKVFLKPEAVLTRNQIVKKNALPHVESFEEAMDAIGTGMRRYDYYVGKDVVVTGYGDSAKVFLEYLLRKGPIGAYGVDVAQAGQVGAITWVLGSTTIEDCVEYITKNRVRYSGIADGIKSGKIKLVTGRVKSFKLKGDAEAYADIKNIVRTRLEDGSSVTSDVVVNAIGYSTEDIFRSIYDPILAIYKEAGVEIPESFKALVAPIAGSTSVADATNVASRLFTSKAFDKAIRDAAKELGGDAGEKLKAYASGQRVYSIGPTFPLADPEELAGVGANEVSIFANGPRTEGFANQYYTDLSRLPFPYLKGKTPKVSTLPPSFRSKSNPSYAEAQLKEAANEKSAFEDGFKSKKKFFIGFRKPASSKSAELFQYPAGYKDLEDYLFYKIGSKIRNGLSLVEELSSEGTATLQKVFSSPIQFNISFQFDKSYRSGAVGVNFNFLRTNNRVLSTKVAEQYEDWKKFVVLEILNDAELAIFADRLLKNRDFTTLSLDNFQISILDAPNTVLGSTAKIDTKAIKVTKK